MSFTRAQLETRIKQQVMSAYGTDLQTTIDLRIDQIIRDTVDNLIKTRLTEIIEDVMNHTDIRERFYNSLEPK
jgi:cell division protein FtsI/penicillin-binding protein 2